MIRTRSISKVIVVQNEALNDFTGVMLHSFFSEDAISFSVQLPHGEDYDLLILDIDFLGYQNVLDYILVNCINSKIILMSENVMLAVDSVYLSIFDFWLKPLKKHHFDRALRKIEQLNCEPVSERIGKIAIAYHGGIDWVEWKSVVRVQADRTYCTMHFVNGKSQTISLTLKDMEERIYAVAPRKFFFRSHKSHLINLLYLDKYVKTQGGYLILKDQSTIPLSSTRRNELLTLMTHI